MPIALSDRVQNIQPSASLMARRRVLQLQAEGRDIIDFTTGEPDMATPAHIVEAAVQAMRRGDTHYTATAGIAPLRQHLARATTQTTGVDYAASQIVVGSGAKQLIYEAIMATVNPGDEVIVPVPYWVSYPDIAKLAGGVPVLAPCLAEHGFKLTAQTLRAHITPRTRWLVLNSPNNPTGAVYDADELAALAAVLADHPDILLMTDDIYGELVYDDVRHANVVAVAPALASRTLLVNGVSKSHAMTGWRLGYAAGPVDLIEAIVKLLGQSTTCASSISQAGALAALAGSQDEVDAMRLTYQARRNLMHGLLSDIPGVSCALPPGAFYLFPNVAGLVGRRTPAGDVLRTDADITMYLLEAADVAVIDGASYGLSPYLRLSYATSDQAIEAGCRQIQQACAQLS